MTDHAARQIITATLSAAPTGLPVAEMTDRIIDALRRGNYFIAHITIDDHGDPA